MQLLPDLGTSGYFSVFTVGGKTSLVRYAEVKFAINPWHPASVENILVVQPFYTMFLQNFICFPASINVPSQYFPQKELLTQWCKLFLKNWLNLNAEWLMLSQLEKQDCVPNLQWSSSLCNHQTSQNCTYL